MTTVMVLFGGQSGEHGISCATAAGVLQAIDRSRYTVIPVGISLDGRWFVMPDDPKKYQITNGQTYTVPASGQQVALVPGTNTLVDIAGDKTWDIDVVFPLLHGPYGEDGTVQGLLEMSTVPYVGCGVLASAACMDKHVTKVLLREAGIPAGNWELITDRDWRFSRKETLSRLEKLGMPVFVKPCRAGSSIGITRVEDATQLPDAIEVARVHDPRVIVESLLTGEEIECAVLAGRDGGRPRTTHAGHIKMDDSVEFYDYKTKYGDTGEVTLEIPAKISEKSMERVRELSERAFDALECEGLARVDFFVDEDNDTVIINEVNTMPGFTPFSMFPAMWANEGMEYSDLVSELIELAMMRPQGLR